MPLRGITHRGRTAYNIAWGRVHCMFTSRPEGPRRGPGGGGGTVGCRVSANTCPYRRGCIDGSSPPSAISACGRRHGLEERTVRRINRIPSLVRRAAFGRSCENIRTLRVSIPRRSSRDDVIAGGCARCVDNRRCSAAIKSWRYWIWIECIGSRM